jgi:hypothetical protein
MSYIFDADDHMLKTFNTVDGQRLTHEAFASGDSVLSRHRCERASGCSYCTFQFAVHGRGFPEDYREKFRAARGLKVKA